jgi:SAM-dependent methyltransferase
MSWYDYPHYYDIAFQSETLPEADFIEAACRKYAVGPVRTLLEPACGTGRLVVELARRGYQVIGLDINRAVLRYLRRRLRRQGLRAVLFVADMSRFGLAQPVDAAYCTFDSFRHLLSERSAWEHLECMAEVVRPGGIYILGLHLLPPDASEECVERWTERRGRTQLTVTLRVLRCDRHRRIEWIRISVLVRKRPVACRQAAHPRGQVMRFRDEFPLRIYTARQFRGLLAKTSRWELADVYDFWYEIDRPLRLTDQMADTVFILRRRR